MQVWLRSTTDGQGRLHFEVDSDSIVSKGIGCLLAADLSGRTAEEIQEVLFLEIQMLSVVVGVHGRRCRHGLPVDSKA